MDSLLCKLAQEIKTYSVVFVLFNNLWDNASPQVIQEIQHYFSTRTIHIWKHISSKQELQHYFLTHFSFPSIIIVHGLQIFSLQQIIVEIFESFKEEYLIRQFLQSNPSSPLNCSFVKITVPLQHGSIFEQFFQFLFEDLKEMNPYLPMLHSPMELSTILKTIIYPLEYIQQEEEMKKVVNNDSVIIIKANEIYQRWEARENLFYCYEMNCCSFSLKQCKKRKQLTLQLSKTRRIVLEQCKESLRWKCEFWKPIVLPHFGSICKPYLQFHISTQGLAQLFSLQYQITEIVEINSYKIKEKEIQFEFQEKNSKNVLLVQTRKPISSQKELETMVSKFFPTIRMPISKL